MHSRRRLAAGFVGRIVGLETEFGLRALYNATERGALLQDLCSYYEQWPDNGGRIYRDGDHPETCTPEVRSGRQLAIYDRAMERLLLERLDAIQPSPHALRLIKNNTGYGYSSFGEFVEVAFGSHENYLVPCGRANAELVWRIGGFLATRQLFAGTGSVVRNEDGLGWHYEIAQRSRHIDRLVNVSASHHRGFIKLNNGAHSDPSRYSRLEVVMGESNILFEPTAYKVDLTSLVLLMDENNQLPRLEPRSVIEATNTTAIDGARTLIELKDGSEMTALAMQQIYYAAAVDFTQRYGLNRFNSSLAFWRDVLLALATGQEHRLYGRVDWVTKQHYLARVVARRGSLTVDEALQRDFHYHDLSAPAGNMPAILRRAHDPPGLERAITRAMRTPPAGRPALRQQLRRLAKGRYGQIDMDWHEVYIDGETYALPDPYGRNDDVANQLMARSDLPRAA